MASKRALRRRSCEGKRRYPSPAAAQRDAAKLARERGGAIDAYPCAFCGRWHVGHTPWRVRQEAEARRGEDR